MPHNANPSQKQKFSTEILAIIALKAVIISLLWLFFFSHPEKPMDANSISRLLLNTNHQQLSQSSNQEFK